MDQKAVIMRTHRHLIGLISLCCLGLPHFIEAKPFKQYQKHVFVDQSGHGNFTTIQKAIDSVPNNNRNWFFINVKAGLYREKINIPYDKPYIVIVGADKRTTRVESDDHESVVNPTFATYADNTVVKSISFVNTYNLPSKGKTNKNPRIPAVAALIGGDKCAFYFVGFAGVQDTLWDFQGRHYFYRCTIQGAVDFIFGTGQSLYKGCVIQVLGELLESGLTGYITAQGRANPYDANGFVFVNCLVFGTGTAYLGRPWRGHARVIFYNSNLTNVVAPQGWDSFNFKGHENQLMFAELGCYGSGSKTAKRVKWLKTKLSGSIFQSLIGLNFIDQGRWVENLPILA